MIARCADTADVVAAVQVAREHQPPVSMRGGGHQIAGSAVCDDGMVIDLSAMKSIHVDPLRQWPELMRAMPESVTPEVLLWSVPPDPSIPSELHWAKTIMVVGVYAGPAGEGEATLAPLRDLGTPLIDLSGTVPYTELQSSADPLFPAGDRFYMKSLFLDSLPDEAIDTLLAWDARRPTPQSLVALRTLGGAVARVGADESSYPHRSSRFNLSMDASWSEPALDDAAVGWSRGTWEAMREYGDGGVYLNFSGFGDEADSLRGAVFGASAQRLAEVRDAYDPDGLFSEAARRP